MLKQKLEAEQLKEVKAGTTFCCHEPGSGCDCRACGQFNAHFQLWIDDMQDRMGGAPAPPEP